MENLTSQFRISNNIVVQVNYRYYIKIIILKLPLKVYILLKGDNLL